MKHRLKMTSRVLLSLLFLTGSEVQGAELTLTDAVIENAQITLEVAAPRQIESGIHFSGQVKLNTDKVAQVVPRLSGIVTEIRKKLGDVVKKNEVIAIIESRELAKAKSDYIEALNRLDFAQISFAREERLLKQKISAKEDYLASRQALRDAELGKYVAGQSLFALGLKPKDLTVYEAVSLGKNRQTEVSAHSLTRYEIRATIKGVVIEKKATLGAAVNGTTPLFTLADPSSVWVDARVRAKDLNRIKSGQEAQVSSQNTGLRTRAEVIYIGSRFDETTQMGMVRLEIQNPRDTHPWRPGLFVSVEMKKQSVSAAVAVPLEAIQRVGDQNVLFIQIGNSFEVRPVTLGISDGRRVEILTGLSEGEQVVTGNSFVIKAEWLNQGGELP